MESRNTEVEFLPHHHLMQVGWAIKTWGFHVQKDKLTTTMNKDICCVVRTVVCLLLIIYISPRKPPRLGEIYRERLSIKQAIDLFCSAVSRIA